MKHISYYSDYKDKHCSFFVFPAISSLSSDMSPIQTSIAQPLDMSPVDSCFPPKFHPLSEKQLVQPPTFSQTKPTDVDQTSGTAKPLVLTHLVEGFIIQEGLEPFPVNKTAAQTSAYSTDFSLHANEICV